MSRNTKEIALIQHRTGKLSEMPQALNQSEFGLASDANRLFIGNTANTYIANRTKFPYQNLEILTECSNLDDFFIYSYKNNIEKTNNTDDREELIEIIPIVVECTKTITDSDIQGLPPSILKINETPIDLPTNMTVGEFIDTINSYASNSKTIVSYIDSKLVFVCYSEELVFESNINIETTIGLPNTNFTAELLPNRKLTDKLDDVLYITDFGLKQYDENKNLADNSELIYKSLIEVYNRQKDEQYYRKVFFPAGKYVFNSQYSFPIISNLYVYGEGIDRTIIKSINSSTDFILLNSNDFENKIENIVIEDMTFESNSEVISKLNNVSNIIFNRVKFKGGVSNKLVDIINSSNVAFNDCEFENGDVGIFAENLVKNVNITNCKFTNVETNGIKIGDGSSDLCKGININGNIFDNTPDLINTNNNAYGIYLNSNSSYVIAHQNQFDEILHTNCANNQYPQPVYIDENSEYNFVETPNAKTDGRKILGVNFSQPNWKFLDYLVNTNGEIVLGIDKEIDANSGLNIVEGQTGLDVRVEGTNVINHYQNDLTFSVDNTSDIILGNPLDSELPVSGNVRLKKTLDVNDNKISNANGSDDVIIETAPDKLISVNETGIENYETLIQQRENEEDPYDLVDDVIPNVAYVKNASKYVFEKIVDYKDVKDGMIELIKFDKNLYGNNVHLSKIFVSARVPFYKTFENEPYKVEYTNPSLDPYEPYEEPINRYYAGDVVYKEFNIDGNYEIKYAVVLKTHDIHYNDEVDFSETNENLHIIDDFNSSYNSVKYIDICADNNYSLTNTYVENYSKPYKFDPSTNIEMLDVQYTNKYGYDNCPDYSNGYDNSVNFDIDGDLDTPVVIKYAGINYALTYNGIYNSELDLHNIDKAFRKYDEGISYSSELDKNYIFDLSKREFNDNELSMNVADKTITIFLYDENRNLFSEDPYGENVVSYHDGALNPAGKLLVRIEFVKDEV